MQYKRLSQLVEGTDRTAQAVRQNGTLLVPANAVIKSNMITKLKMLGYGGLYVMSDEEEATFFSYEEEMEIIEALRVIYNSNLYDAFDKELAKALNTIEEVIASVVTKAVWNEDLFAHTYKVRGKSDFDFYHALSVCALTITVGKEMNLSMGDLEHVAIAALLHDIGKGALISRKAGDAKEHPRTIAEVLKDRHYNIRVILAVQQHHELLDGSGYPMGLNKEKICMEAQILSVCDAYDRQANPRKDSSIQGEQEALEYLFGDGGEKYNSSAVHALSHCVRPFPVGARVKLSNNLVGTVHKNDRHFPLRPSVNVNGKIYDLKSEKLDVTVAGIVDY